jgi:transcriptional regulator with XRE-family HTH domain
MQGNHSRRRSGNITGGIMNFSAWFKDKLATSGLTVMEFVQRSRISKPMVYFFLQGKRLPTPTTATKVAETLRVPVEDVMGFARSGAGRPANQKAGVGGTSL